MFSASICVTLCWRANSDFFANFGFSFTVYQLAGRPNPNWGNEIQEMPWLLEDVNLRDSLQVGTPAPLQALFTIELDGLDNLSYYTF